MPFDIGTLKLRISLFIHDKTAGLQGRNLLRITCIAGILLLVLVGGIFCAIRFLDGGGRAVAGGENSAFYLLLREYDQNSGEPEKQDRELDRLEKKADGAEAWLSILKRRRALARLDSRYLPSYQQSARRARKGYPYSEPLAAVAAAAFVQNTAINRETEEELRACLSLISNDQGTGPLGALCLSLHVLLGDLKNPGIAADTLPPGLETRVLGGALSAGDTETIARCLAIVKILKGDTEGAAAEIYGALSNGDSGYSPASASAPFLRFAAEYFYDFGDMLRSAELLSLLHGDAALLRQADALWLAGYPDNARYIWTILNTPTGDNISARDDSSTGDDSSAVIARSIYNLALTAESPEEAAALLRRLFNLPAGPSPAVSFGAIRYSRLLAASQAVALLAGSGKKSGSAVDLFDLEVLKRLSENEGLGRLTAETWLLLGRYPEDERFYRWAAWFFDRQRNYAESAILLKTAARHGFSGGWVSFHEAVQLLAAGKSDDAERLFNSALTGDSGWAAAANLGRISESRRAPRRALEYYETAAASAPDRETASRIHVRIAGCLKTLGRPEESRRVLEYALDLNPDNLNASLELERLGVTGQDVRR